MAVVHDHCGKNRGAANGLYMMISFLSTASVVVFIGWLSDLLGISTAFAHKCLVGLGRSANHPVSAQVIIKRKSIYTSLV